jgi:hypothetical protein
MTAGATQYERNQAVDNYQQRLTGVLPPAQNVPAQSNPQSIPQANPVYNPTNPTPNPPAATAKNTDTEKTARLLSIKATALEMMDRIISLSNNYDFYDLGAVNDRNNGGAR